MHMKEYRTVKKVFKSDQDAKRKKNARKGKWLDAVKKNLRLLKLDN